ncbi:MAG TPA: glycosyltransferase [Pseudolysinimonas sp.]|nr:glycosyltransferase [Pseudolysinimonas sp.]
MRIAQVVSSMLAPLGGAEQYCLELSRWLRDQGHEVTIVTGWISPEVDSSLRAEGFRVRLVSGRRPYPPDRKGSRPAAAVFHALDLLGSIVTAPRLRRVLAEGWDLVHVHRVAGWGSALLRSTRAPVLLTVHDYALVDTSTTLLRRGVEAPRPPWVQRLRTAVVSRTVDRAHLIFPSARLREKHAAWGLRLPARTSVLPHGWRLGTAGPDTGPPPSTGEHVVFLFLGKLLDTKGVGLLLEAWGAGIEGAELWIAGSGPMEPHVDRAAAAGRVRKLGWLDETARRTALAEASALVIPSIWPENFQLAAAEGVLAGLPILSTTIAAPPVVDPDRSGLLVAADAAAIRSGLERLMDPGLRGRLSAGAREVAGELDFDVHGARVLALYGAEEGVNAR